jgi:SNF2 family DNA or RNA helicase
MLKETDLHEYQKKAVEHIITHKYCGLFLEMGLGKTVSTLTAVEKLMYDYLEVNSVLVIAPKRVAETVWAEEAQNWEHLRHLTFSKIIGTERQRLEAFHKKADIHIISRDNIAWLCGICASNLPYDMLVIDELSSFKNHQSQRFKALRLARPWIKRVVGLTGTPAPNGLIDLWPQIYLMDRGERLGKTITKYRSTYFTPGRSNGYVVYNYNLQGGAEQAIRNKIGDICISMQAQDYLNMPMLTSNVIRLSMPDDIQDAYDKFEKDSIMKLVNNEVEITALNAAGLSNKLLQFANGAIYDEDKNVYPIHDIKLKALEEIVEEACGKPVLVAWTYQFDRDRIMKYLSKYKPRELKTAKDIQDWNDGKVQLMLAHPASAGHGLNLQAGGNIIVWFGLTWSLELYQQFNARLYRQGQKQGVIIHHLCMNQTHDEDVMLALRNKDKVQMSLMNSIKAKIDNYIKNN